jgi:hypothetical protein
VCNAAPRLLRIADLDVENRATLSLARGCHSVITVCSKRAALDGV